MTPKEIEAVARAVIKSLKSTSKEICVEKNIPMPEINESTPTRMAVSKYPFNKMEIGDSFAVPLLEASPTAVRTRLISAAYYVAPPSWKFSTRVDKDKSEMRIWRVA